MESLPPALWFGLTLGAQPKGRQAGVVTGLAFRSFPQLPFSPCSSFHLCFDMKCSLATLQWGCWDLKPDQGRRGPGDWSPDWVREGMEELGPARIHLDPGFPCRRTFSLRTCFSWLSKSKVGKRIPLNWESQPSEPHGTDRRRSSYWYQQACKAQELKIKLANWSHTVSIHCRPNISLWAFSHCPPKCDLLMATKNIWYDMSRTIFMQHFPHPRYHHNKKKYFDDHAYKIICLTLFVKYIS